MTKETVLAALLKEKNFISGEAISHELGVTRAAVSQAVKALRQEGYVIESVTNRGYRLLSSPDLLSAGALQAFLGDKRMQSVLCFDKTDSTNLRLREAALSPNTPGGLIAIANEQTAGSGRRGRSFISPKDKGIYLSMLLKPSDLGSVNGTPVAAGCDNPSVYPASAWTSITSWTAVAMCNAVETVYGVRPKIKWVNDLLLNEKKICGILTQMDLESETGEIRDIIIGIGINVQESQEDFPEELQNIASSIRQETGVFQPRILLAAEMIRELDKLYALWPAASADYLAQYRLDSIVTGREIRVLSPSGEKKAIAESIGDDFSLQVRYEDNTRDTLRGGEISIRPA